MESLRDPISMNQKEFTSKKSVAIYIYPKNPDLIWEELGEGNPRNSLTMGGESTDPGCGKNLGSDGMEKN